jgi:hypothetical protein
LFFLSLHQSSSTTTINHRQLSLRRRRDIVVTVANMTAVVATDTRNRPI